MKTYENFDAWLKEHDAKVRADAIEECIHVVARETHDGNLCDELERLNEVEE